MAENFPTEKSEQGEDERSNKLSRIQKMLASLLRRERKIDEEITEDVISARSSIQFVASSALLSTQNDDDE
jgi:hypothetical protein